jgi:acetolactate synthase small subunit
MSTAPCAASLPPAAGSNVPCVACFAVQAEADPGILPRVLGLFAKRSLVPERWAGHRSLHDESELTIDLQVAGLDAAETDYLARCLGQIPGVVAVLTAEKAAVL